MKKFFKIFNVFLIFFFNVFILSVYCERYTYALNDEVTIIINSMNRQHPDQTVVLKSIRWHSVEAGISCIQIIIYRNDFKTKQRKYQREMFPNSFG